MTALPSRHSTLSRDPRSRRDRGFSSPACSLCSWWTVARLCWMALGGVNAVLRALVYALDYLRTGDSAVLVRFSAGTGFSRKTAKVVRSWPELGRAGPYVIRQPLARAERRR